MIEKLGSGLYNNIASTSVYPTNVGTYRITGSVPGMPVGSSPYGLLFIVGCTGYTLHIYEDALGHFYTTFTGNVEKPTGWTLFSGSVVQII